MKTIYFLGKSTEEKRDLMMYIGLLLSMNHQVTLSTQWPYLLSELETVHYNDRYTITKNFDEDVDSEVLKECGYYLVDVDAKPIEWNEEATYCLVVSPKRTAVEAAESYTTQINEQTVIVMQDMLYDTTISPKYIKKRLKLSNKQSIHIQYLNDRDLVVHLENHYNDTLSIKHLSSTYKKHLLAVIGELDESLKPSLKQMLKKSVKKG